MRFFCIVLLLALTCLAYADTGGVIADEINNVICLFVRLIWLVTGSLMALVIIFAGVKWLVSGEDPGARTSAKTFIVSAFIGLIIIFTAVPVVDYLVGGVLGYGFSCGFFPELDFSDSVLTIRSDPSEEADSGDSSDEGEEPDLYIVAAGFREGKIGILSADDTQGDSGGVPFCVVIGEKGGRTSAANVDFTLRLDRTNDLGWDEVCRGTISKVERGGFAEAACLIDPEQARLAREYPDDFRFTLEVNPDDKVLETSGGELNNMIQRFVSELDTGLRCDTTTAVQDSGDVPYEADEICRLCCVPGDSGCHIDEDGGEGFHTSGLVKNCEPLGENRYYIEITVEGVGTMGDSATRNNPRCGRCEEDGETVLVGECLGKKMCRYVSGEYKLRMDSSCSTLRTLSVPEPEPSASCEGGSADFLEVLALTWMHRSCSDLMDVAREVLAEKPCLDLIVFPEYSCSGSDLEEAREIAGTYWVNIILATVASDEVLDVSSEDFRNVKYSSILAIDLSGNVVYKKLKTTGSDWCWREGGRSCDYIVYCLNRQGYIEDWPYDIDAQICEGYDNVYCDICNENHRYEYCITGVEVDSKARELALSTSKPFTLTSRHGRDFTVFSSICADYDDERMIAMNAGANADIFVWTTVMGDDVTGPHGSERLKRSMRDIIVPMYVDTGVIKSDGYILVADNSKSSVTNMQLNPLEEEEAAEWNYVYAKIRLPS